MGFNCHVINWDLLKRIENVDNKSYHKGNSNCERSMIK